jgi:GNAT superfamily N-acetyltransferase
VSDVDLRPLVAADAEAAVGLIGACFAQADRDAGRAPWTPPPERVATFVRRMARFTETDPEGCWAAEDADGLAGIAVAIRRGRLWGLALLFTRPDLQSRGVGGQLLRRARGTAAGALVEVIQSSQDHRAIRTYAGLGLALHPAVALRGEVDRSRLPSEDAGIREGTADDLDIVDGVDRFLRGDGPRTPDVAAMLDADAAQLLLHEEGPHRGFALTSSGHPVCLGATSERGARALLVAMLARMGDEVSLEGLTATQRWAVDVGLAVRLRVEPTGPMFVRGWPAFPEHYLPSGVYF